MDGHKAIWLVQSNPATGVWLGQGTPDWNFADVFWPLVILLGLVLVMIVVALVLRRRLLRQDESPMGFTLSDMRRMHREGMLSDEEFENARATILERATGESAESRAGRSGEAEAPQGEDQADNGSDSDKGPREDERPGG